MHMALAYTERKMVSNHLLMILLLLFSISNNFAGNIQPSCKNKDTDVLILGAGMAGISAAKTLSDGGLKNFIILEGRTEIGGRMRSQVLNTTGARIELGANWIEALNRSDLDAHPLWRLAKQCGGLGGQFEDDVVFQHVHMFDQNGMNITDSKSFLSRRSQWRMVAKELDKYVEQWDNHTLPDITVREALKKFGWFPKNAIDEAIEWLGFDWEAAAPPENGSFYYNYPLGHDYMYLVTDQNVGYEKLVHCLANTFLSPGDNRLHLNNVVKQIDWSPTNSCVCVSVVEGGVSNQYCATAAVVTFSIGVLKSGNVLFNPLLPNSKLEAIKKIGNGLYLKVFLEFKVIFWTKDKVNSIVRADKERGHYIHFQSLAQCISGNPPILIATLTGENARRAYTQSDEKIKAEVMSVLRTIFGEDIPDPLSLTVPDWGKNPLYEGMFSFRPIGFTEADLDSLRTNASGLHFAGEALADAEGYVQSALESGNLTASKILKHLGYDCYT